LNIKPCMGHISGTWELLLCEYWRKGMIIDEKNTDLKRLKLRFLSEIGRLHWNQGEEVAHFAWLGEPWKVLYKDCSFRPDPLRAVPEKNCWASGAQTIVKWSLVVPFQNCVWWAHATCMQDCCHQQT
jgi:hypothetical protein